MANPTTEGKHVPVCMLSELLAEKFIPAAMGSGFKFVDKAIPYPGGTNVSTFTYKPANPLDLFSDSAPTDWTGAHIDYNGIAVIILNASSSPLTLVAMEDLGQQVSYPDVSRGKAGIVAHEIPGIQQFPTASLHQTDGRPALIAGVGIYRFAAHKGSTLISTWGLSFALAFADTAEPNRPKIAVAVSGEGDSSKKTAQYYWSITADLGKDGPELTDFLYATKNGTTCNLNSVGPKLTVWASYPPASVDPPEVEPHMAPLVVWVRDISSPIGMGRVW